jgi:hypothetical protein
MELVAVSAYYRACLVDWGVPMPRRFDKFGPFAAKFLLAGSAFTLLFSCAQIDVRNAIAAPDIKVGETWTYKTVVVDLRDPQRKRTEYSYTQQVEKVTYTEVWVREKSAVLAGYEAQIKFDKQWNPIEAPLPDTSTIVRFEPYLPRFVFPLAPNRSWTGNFTVSNPKSREIGEQGQSEGKVIAWDEVSVPAGRFKALRIETLTPYYTGTRTPIIFANPNLYGGAQEQYWYVPELKNFVKYIRKDYLGRDQTRSTEAELIDYRLDDRAFVQ